MLVENKMMDVQQLIRLHVEVNQINEELLKIQEELKEYCKEGIDIEDKLSNATDVVELLELGLSITKRFDRISYLKRRNEELKLRNKQVNLEVQWLLWKHPEWHP